MRSLSVLRRSVGASFVTGILLGVAGTTFGATLLGSAQFSDIQPGSYYDAAVGRLVDEGIIKGFPDGTFRPGQFVSRADVAVMIDRAINGTSDEPTGGAASSSSRSSRSSSSSSSSKSSSSSLAPVTEAGAVHFTTAGFNVAKGSKRATITIIRTGGKKGEVKVDYAFGGGTAESGLDYSPGSGTVTFADGETTKNITVVLMRQDDSPQRTLEVTLSNPKGGVVLGALSKATLTLLGTTGGTSGSSSSASSTVTGTPGVGSLGFSAVTYAMNEEGGSVNITVNRVNGSSGEVKVNYATSDGTAKAGSNYSNSNGTLTFAGGETTKSFSVQLSDNTTIDGNKTFNLTLSNPTNGAGINRSTATVTVVDTDALAATGTGSIQFAVASQTVTESAGSVTVTVNRQVSFTATVSVNYATSDGSATASSDYTSANGTITFAPGEMSKTFEVPIIKDTLTEGEETINLTLSTLTGPATFGDRSTATIRIQ